ncbi:MAG TPA: hypothetical protein VKX16_06570 [Chloroflexota bacterium]|nr:hypothetical protein [Chloroflexota bacterium]
MILKRVPFVAVLFALAVIPVSAFAAGGRDAGGKLSSQHRAGATKHGRSHSSAVSFSIVTVRAESYGSAPDWKFQRQPLSSVASGKAVNIGTYVNVLSAPANAVAVLDVTGVLGRTVMLHDQKSYNLGSNPTGLWRLSYPYVGHALGVRNITVRVSINNSTWKTGVTHFRVARAV